MIRCDFHTHTTFSDGKDDIEAMLAAAAERGMQKIAITDHFDPNDPKEKISSISEKMLLTHFKAIDRAALKAPFPVERGIETVVLPNGSLPLSENVHKRCQKIITSCHYLHFNGTIRPGEWLNAAYWDCFKESILLSARSEGDILGHCEEYLPIKPMLAGITTTFEERRAICRAIADQYFDPPYVDKLADCLLTSGKACELHCETRSPRGWVIERLAARGVLFSAGSDAHTAAHIGQVDFAYAEAARLGLKMLC